MEFPAQVLRKSPFSPPWKPLCRFSRTSARTSTGPAPAGAGRSIFPPYTSV